MADLKTLFKDAEAAVKGLADDLRPVAFRFFLEQNIGSLPTVTKQALSKAQPRTATAKKNSGQKRKAGKGARPPQVINLKLSLAKLRKFTDPKKPKSNQEQYAVLASFLKDEEIADRVGQDEMYTCYRMLQWRAPKVMEQVFHDARNKKGWFTPRGEDEKFALTHIGQQFVEHDLPSAKAKEG